ncbi:hypothetical protein [Streptomyces sp. NPDC051909]|uniref:hypothetical protein n=1 Tax=Streptomyces sp. NPDC051909 TaxID=3154944 RepID=UPI00341B8137
MNITEDILRLLPSDARTGRSGLRDSGPAGGTPDGITVESLGRADAGRASWCFCISAAFATRVGA